MHPKQTVKLITLKLTIEFSAKCELLLNGKIAKCTANSEKYELKPFETVKRATQMPYNHRVIFFFFGMCHFISFRLK